MHPCGAAYKENQMHAAHRATPAPRFKTSLASSLTLGLASCAMLPVLVSIEHGQIAAIGAAAVLHDLSTAAHGLQQASGKLRGHQQNSTPSVPWCMVPYSQAFVAAAATFLILVPAFWAALLALSSLTCLSWKTLASLAFGDASSYNSYSTFARASLPELSLLSLSGGYIASLVLQHPLMMCLKTSRPKSPSPSSCRDPR